MVLFAAAVHHGHGQARLPLNPRSQRCTLLSPRLNKVVDAHRCCSVFRKQPCHNRCSSLHGFFETLRAELAPQGVDVLMVCPSFTATGIGTAALAGKGGCVRHAQSTIGAQARPEDIARAVARDAAARRRLCVPTRLAKVAYVLSRLWPRGYERAMVRTQRREMEAEAA